MAERSVDGDDPFEHAACALLHTDCAGLIIRANATACNWFGYRHEQVVGKLRMADLMPVGARLFYQTHCLPVLRLQGSVAEIQLDLYERQQVQVPMLVNIVRRGRDGGEIDHWALFKATDRQAHERQLQALNVQLSQADRRKDEFLATLSHELRNPLAPMRSALDILKMKFGGAGEERLLGAFDRQLRHLTHLVDDLMDVSRITQGRMQLRRSPQDLCVLVRSAVHDMAGAVAAARHVLDVTLPDYPLLVDGDATRLVQVVTNLLANAVKYTPDGGRLALTLHGEDGSAVLRVVDNGIGIPAPALGTVFDMFSQLEPALDRARGGLGIGLALVRGIALLHQGSVAADSAGLGAGSVFTLRLPLLVRAGAASPTAGEAAPAGAIAAGLRVMVVDDNRDAAVMLAQVLELSGCRTEVAHSGAQALELFAAFAPQVALLDIGMPGMNGFELARRLRQAPAPAGGLTLIAATGWGQDKDRQRALESGFDHHLTKPIDLARLHQLLPGAAPVAPDRR